MQLHLRRWSPGLLEPITGGGLLTEPDKAYAMTRPDGVTYFFDAQGYATSIRDRNANEIEFKYEYRSPTRPLCEAAAIALPPPGKVCVRKVVQVLDPADRALSITYKPRRIQDLTAGLVPPGGLPPGQELETTQPVGALGPQASGPVASIVDHKGRVYEFSYDDNGYLTSLTEAKGALNPAGGADQRSWAFAYEGNPSIPPLLRRAPLSSVTDPRGAVTRFAHRSDSQVAGQEECGTQFDGVGEIGDGIVHRRRVASLLDRGEQGTAGASRTFAYACAEEGGQEVHRASVTDARAFAWTHRMDSLGRPRELVDPRATRTLLEWDGDNNASRIAEAARSADEAVTAMAYNENGQLLTSTDPEGRRTTLTYETARGIGALQTPRTGLGTAPPRSLDADRGFVTDLTSIKRPKGATTAFEHDGFGNVRFTTDARGFVAETRYDAKGQVTDEFDEERNHTRYPPEAYDANGLPTQVIDPRGKVWRYAYDAVGNVTSMMDPRYTGAGCGADGRRRYRTELAYDSYDRAFSELVPKDSGACSFIQRDRRYDPNGNVVVETDGNRATRIRTYTAMDRPEEDRSPAAPHVDGSTASEVSRREYDREDNLVLQVTPRGMRTPGVAEDFATRFTPDEVGRTVASSRRSRGGGADVDLTTSYAYDRRDNVVGLVDPAHNTTGDPVANAAVAAKRRFSYGYDRANNRVAEVEDPAGKAYRTVHEYDSNDNLHKTTDPRGTATPAAGDYTTTRLYYPDDQLEHLIDGEGRKTSLVRRRDGKVISVVKPKGTASPGAGDYETKVDYWPTGEVRSRTLPFDARQYGSRDLRVSYELNDVGDPVRVIDARGEAIANTFLDTGELATTTRASWWKMAGGRVAERGPGERGGGGPGAVRPPAGGQGDFGGVSRSPMPGVVPAAGRASFAYDGELRLTGATDAAESRVSLGRDSLGRVSEVARPLDAQRAIVERYGYDFNGNRVRVTDPEGNATVSEFDQFDRPVAQSRPGSPGTETTRTSYLPNGTVGEVVSPRGTRHTREYDALDRVVREVDPEGNVMRRDYDSVGNAVWERSPRGNRDPFPAGEQRDWFDTRRDYNAANELIKVTNGFGHEWRFSYDPNGNQTRVDAPGAARSDGSPEARQVTERAYDGLDRRWRESTGASTGGDRVRTRVWEFDPNGQLRRVVNPAGVDPGTGLPKFTYATDGAVSSSPEAAKDATVHEYDAPADPSLVSAKRLPWGERDAHDAVKYRQGFAYSDRGFLESVDPPHTGTANTAGRTGYSHYATGWIKTATDSHKAIDYDYTVRGDQKLWASTKAGATNPGRTVSREHWPSGALRQRTGRKPSAGPDEVYRYSYDYDPNRSLTQMTDHRLDRRTGYGYDRADRQVRVDEGSFEVGEDQRRGKDTSLSYDENSNVTTRRSDGRFSADAYVGGKTAGFVYDRLDREVSMAVDPTAGAARRTQTAWWDSGARRERWTRRADSADDTLERSFFFSDGRISRMDRKRFGAPAGSFTKQADYAYDPNGNRSADERGSHAYNSRDQLVAWSEPDGGPRTTYALNGSGSITSQTSDGTTTRFTYAPDGERLRSSETDGFTTTYQYDPGGLGEIVGYHTEGESYETTHVYDEFARQKRSDDGRGEAASFSHDGLDRRDTKTERGKTFDLSYVGSSEALSQEQQFEGTELRSYDYDSQMGRLGMAREGDGQPARYRAYSTDANGTVEGLEDQNGEMPAQDRYSYDPYGALTDQAGGGGGGPPGGGDNEPAGEDARANPFRFEGHYYDQNVQTYDMRARPYLPQAGRFLTEDRYESAAGDLALETDALTQDRYAFAGGNPVNNIEYDGHDPHAIEDSCEDNGGSDCGERAAKAVNEQSAAASRGDAPEPTGDAGLSDAASGDGYETQRTTPPSPTTKIYNHTVPDRPVSPERAQEITNSLQGHLQESGATLSVQESLGLEGALAEGQVDEYKAVHAPVPPEVIEGAFRFVDTATTFAGLAGAAKSAVKACATKCAGAIKSPFSASANAPKTADDLPPVQGGAPGAGGRASKLGPHPDAVGSHTRFAREPGGRISKYTTFDDFGNELFRFRGSGRSHGPFDPPFVLEPPRGKGHGARPNRAREPMPNELPNGY